MAEHSAASLSQLSAQLLANGFISRELDLLSLFATPASLPSTTSIEAYNKHQQRLIQEDRARDQILKCLWSMLNSKLDHMDLVEKLRTKNDVMQYEVDRFKNMVGVERRLREAKEKEMEGEKAKAKQAIRELTTEQERHRYAKEELAKAKNALQFVRTQVTHDNKRRDLELSKALSSLQKTTSDATQSRFIVLNSQIQHSRSTPMLGGVGMDLLEDSLRESEESRAEVAMENRGLRELLGEIEEWIENVEEIRGLGLEESEVVVDGDESMLVPLPHFSRPVSAFGPLLHTKLHRIKISISNIVTSIDERVSSARSEMTEELERERLGKAGEKSERKKLEAELEEALDRIKESEQLIADFTKAGMLGATTDDVAPDDSVDDDVIMSPKPNETKVPVTKEATKLSDFEAKRAQSVKDFLGDLGLDSPVATSSVLTSSKPATSAPAPKPAASKESSSSSATSNPARRPTSSSTASRPRQEVKHLSPLSEVSEPSSSRSSTTSRSRDVPSPFLSSTSAPPPTNALAGILAMADSPPPTTLPLKKKVAISTTSSVPVLTANRRDVGKSSTVKTTTTTTKKTTSTLKPSTTTREKENSTRTAGGSQNGQVRLKSLGESRSNIRGM